MTEIILDDAAIDEIEARYQNASPHYVVNWSKGEHALMQASGWRPLNEEQPRTIAAFDKDDGYLDLLFCAEARTDIPALCHDWRVLRAKVERIKSKTAWHRDGVGPDVPVLQERYDKLIAQRNDLQSQLEQVTKERDEEKRLRSELKEIAQTGIAEVSSVGSALKDNAITDFRARAIALCRDKATEYKRIADLRTKNLNDIGAAIEQARADAANDLAVHLEQLK